MQEYNDLSKYSEEIQECLPDEIKDYLALKSDAEYYTLLSDILNKHDIFRKILEIMNIKFTYRFCIPIKKI